MRTRIFTLLLIALFSFKASASVWEHDDENTWDTSWQNAYVNWIASKVEPTFFKDLGKPYSDLAIDCADAHYALLAYFARDNKLPFVVNKGSMTNLTTKFDHIEDEHDRFVAFARYLAAHYGTESLVHRDTYPIAIEEIKSGDLFMYKVGSDGNYTRHTYIIKNINPDGTFDVMYSTQANAAAGGPLKRKKQYMFKKSPKNRGQDYQRWGFRRAKPSQYAALKQQDIPGADFEQYDLAQEMTATEFFRHVKRVHQTMAESPQMKLTRHFTGLCQTLEERIDIVEKGVSYKNSIQNRCMNYSEYDTHSTPSRDSGIMADYENYQADYSEISDDGNIDQVDSELATNTETVFNEGRTPDEENQLQLSCPIEFGKDANGNKLLTNLGIFRDRLFANNVSYHPNDNLHRRWGILKGSKTQCEEFYGYPE